MPSPGYTEHEYGPDDPGFNIPMWSDPHLVISGPAGVIFVTPLAGFTTAGKTLSMTASADLDLAAQNALVTAAKDGIELFTVGKLGEADRPVDETGIRMAAASGPVTIQAQSDEARLTKHDDGSSPPSMKALAARRWGRHTGRTRSQYE